MEKPYEKKITWTIRNFSSLRSENIESDNFVVGDSKWHLLAKPKGEMENNCLSLFLDVADSETLSPGWRRHTKFCLTVVNQLLEKLSKVEETQMWFDQKTPTLGYAEMLPLTKLLDTNGGFLVNGEVKIVAELDVLEVIGKSDVLEETSYAIESMDVNGFQVLPSEVESVSSLFEKHVSKFRMNVLLSLTESLCQSHEKLSNGDLADAYSALQYVKKAGFKVDWLENELKKAGDARLHDIKEELKDLKQKSADMEALVEFLQ